MGDRCGCGVGGCDGNEVEMHVVWCPSQAFPWCLPYPIPRGEGEAPVFFKTRGALLMRGRGWAKSGSVVLRGRATFSPLYFPLCWSVGEWVGAS